MICCKYILRHLQIARHKYGIINNVSSTKRRTIVSHPSRSGFFRSPRRSIAITLTISFVLLWFSSGTSKSSLNILVGVCSVAASMTMDGPAYLALGKRLFNEFKYDEAAAELWKAILLHGAVPPEEQYDVTAVFQLFMQCYTIQNKLADGFAFVALESFKRGQSDMGKMYLQQALSVDPTNAAANAVQKQFGGLHVLGDLENDKINTQSTTRTKTKVRKHDTNHDLVGHTPEQLYEVASKHFSEKNYEECADIFEISCQRSGFSLGPSCVNAVYCRNLIVDWGYNGTLFDHDMERVINFTKEEVAKYRLTLSDGISAKTDNNFHWNRATSVHPHMMLGYPVDPILKRYVAESASSLDEKMARASHSISTERGGSSQGLQLPALPADMPFDIEQARRKFQKEKESKGQQYRIRIGFVGSGFNSKAVLYLSHDMFRFFNPDKFEVHIFSFGPPDNELFIKHGMRGVDWRERVKANVDFFHDCQAMKMNHIKAARYINEHQIHILIEWDGFARQGERAQGLFALRPSPIQILHQEYLGTSGAQYVDYLFTDIVTTPPTLTHLYTEKLIWMPNHFFSKGHAYQEKDIMKPSYKYKPKQNPYKFGTGSPIENRCLSPPNVGPVKPSFVYCNFNKLLKANPETVRSWIRILQEVPDSLLCLVENPTEAMPYFRKFVYESVGLFDSNGTAGDELNARIHFLPWERNPFDHQARNHDLCNVMLDSHPYNGHTVAQDALYGGVPIITRSDGDDMSSRVTTSANVVLGVEELNAYNGIREYEDKAIALGINKTNYAVIRRKIIDACLQRNPMHPYFDVARYVKNFEQGLEISWKHFLLGFKPDHILIEESKEAARGTFDEEILANPPDGKPKREKTKIIKMDNSDEL